MKVETYSDSIIDNGSGASTKKKESQRNFAEDMQKKEVFF